MKTEGFQITKDGAILIHPDITGSTDSIQIPQVDTIYGAGFGTAITDQARAFAACREPIAHFLTFIVASDMVDKWFTIDDPDTTDTDPALDRGVQSALNKLKFKKQLRLALESARIYGKSLLVYGFNDAKTIDDLKKPRTKGAQVMQVAVYPETYRENKVKDWQVYAVDLNPNSQRYGLPVWYKLNRASMNSTGQQVNDWLIVHYTRVCEVGDGTSVLDKVWDDMSCGRNIRWGTAQWMFRTGSGFPVVSFPAGTTKEQLQAFHESGLFNNLMSRTGIFVAQNSIQENTGMMFEFKGPAGQSLDPTPFFKTNIEQISIATGYPQAKLVGAQAGQVTGSEVNQQEYYKAVSRDQENYCEEPIRWLIDRLVESQQITLIKSAVDESDYRHKTVGDYVINWNSAFELSELDESQVKLNNVNASVSQLEYMTIDEVRAENELDPLPNKEGEKLKGASQSMGQEFIVKTNQGMRQPNANTNEEGSKLETGQPEQAGNASGNGS